MEVVTALGIVHQHPDTILGIGVIIGVVTVIVLNLLFSLFNKYIVIG